MTDTADGLPLVAQDAHFMRSLEIIASTWNRKLQEKGNG